MQVTLWSILGLVALSLAIATSLLLVKSSQVTHTSEPYRIVYTSLQEEEHARLISCDLQGRSAKPLTDGEALDCFPVCSPALPGQDARIAFIRLELDQPDWGVETQPGGVWIVSASGGVAARANSAVRSLVPTAPTWSPDGKRLGFGGCEDLNGDNNLGLDEMGVYVCEVDSTHTTRVAAAVVEGSGLAWSPAGDWGLVPVRRNNLPSVSLLDGSSGNLTPLLDGKASRACWSPDGRRIAAFAEKRILILPMGGGQPDTLDAPPGEVIELIWAPSPDDPEGRLLAVVAPQASHGAGQLYWRSPAAENRAGWQALTFESEVFGLAPSPDGRYVAFSAPNPSGSFFNVDLYLLEFGQPQPRRLTSDEGYEGLATWAPVAAK